MEESTRKQDNSFADKLSITTGMKGEHCRLQIRMERL